MDFDFFAIFKAWLSLLAVSFTLMPIIFVLEWRKRKTAEGFSSVNLVLGTFMACCWLKHGFLTDDWTTIRIFGFNISMMAIYITIYAYFQPNRKPLLGQLFVAASTIFVIYSYVDSFETMQQLPELSERSNIMGSIAATAQVLRNGGAIYEIIRIFRFKHTEYVPAAFQFMIFAVVSQWILYGILTENIHIVRAHLPGLLVNVFTISLFYFYPPLTWRVPIIGTGPQQKKTE